MALGPKNGWKLTTVWFYCFVPVITYVLFRPIIRSNIMNISLFETHLRFASNPMSRSYRENPIASLLFLPPGKSEEEDLVQAKCLQAWIPLLFLLQIHYYSKERRKRYLSFFGRVWETRVCVQCALKETPFLAKSLMPLDGSICYLLARGFIIHFLERSICKSGEVTI